MVILDLGMPQLSGLDVVRQLRGDAAGPMVVIAVTGHAFGGMEQHALEAGCDAYLSKPCLPEELAEVIRTHLAQRER